MTEQQISTLRVTKEPFHQLGCDCGGGFREVDVKVSIDATAPERDQRIAVVHEIIGAYLGAVLSTGMITQIAEDIIDGLEQLGELKTE